MPTTNQKWGARAPPCPMVSAPMLGMLSDVLQIMYYSISPDVQCPGMEIKAIQCRTTYYTVSQKKRDTKLLPITSPNVSGLDCSNGNYSCLPVMLQLSAVDWHVN